MDFVKLSQKVSTNKKSKISKNLSLYVFMQVDLTPNFIRCKGIVVSNSTKK